MFKGFVFEYGKIRDNLNEICYSTCVRSLGYDVKLTILELLQEINGFNLSTIIFVFILVKLWNEARKNVFC